jgi:aminodeoxyfutalosine synthase
MAGSEEQNPSMSTYDLVTLIKSAGRIPVERDTLYHELMDWSDHSFQEDKEYRGYIPLPALN